MALPDLAWLFREAYVPIFIMRFKRHTMLRAGLRIREVTECLPASAIRLT